MGVAERRQREKEERRTAILDAAEGVFLEKGIVAATMDEIAARAEVSKGALYLHFASKDDLFLGIAIRTLRAAVVRTERAAAHAGSGIERLRTTMTAYGEFAEDQRDRFFVSMSWLSSQYVVSGDSPQFEEYRALIARLFGIAVTVIAAGQSDGTVRTDVAAPDLALRLWGGMFGVLLLRLRTQEVIRRLPAGASLGEAVTGYVELALRGCRPTAAGEAS